MDWLPLQVAVIEPVTQIHAIEQDSNLQPFSVEADAPEIEPHQLGQTSNLLVHGTFNQLSYHGQAQTSL